MSSEGSRPQSQERGVGGVFCVEGDATKDRRPPLYSLGRYALQTRNPGLSPDLRSDPTSSHTHARATAPVH